MASTRKKSDKNQGRLRIGNQWNAIRIIALSQNNPLKAIAEFVENSIDAGATTISIVRGKHRGEQYLKVIDDGAGIQDFHYVATHIGDSIKRRLKESGATGIQGEFGIGLLSFWTVGEELLLTSKPADGPAQRLHLMKDSPDFSITPTRELFDRPGTTLHIQPLLPGVRMVNGEKVQAYLASELRDRIAKSGVTIRIIDRTARKDLVVEPRRFSGRLLHNLPEIRTPLGEVYVELYLTEPASAGGVGLYKQGTRVLPSLTRVDSLHHSPWTSGLLEGIIDVSFLQLTPGTRDGVILDSAFDSFVNALSPLEKQLEMIVDEQRRAEEEEASRGMLRRITKALKEAFALLPSEEYGWLSAKTPVRTRSGGTGGEDGAGETGDGAGTAEGAVGEAPGSDGTVIEPVGIAETEREEGREGQRAFFEFPGPLYRVDIRPGSARVGVGKECRLRAVPRDKSRRTIDSDVEITWSIVQGAGFLDTDHGEFVVYRAPAEPELAIVSARAVQDQLTCDAEAMITVTAELAPSGGAGGVGAMGRQGLPGYTFTYAPGELWRSRYDPAKSLITVNSAHADFVFAARSPATKLRYVSRLFAKEIVLANFPGAGKEELLERMVELGLYMDSFLR